MIETLPEVIDTPATQAEALPATTHSGVISGEVWLDDGTETSLPATPEQLKAENVRRTSDLHTLLVSIPPGQMRAGAMEQFPEVVSYLHVVHPIELNEGSPAEHYTLLGELLDRAVHSVGGSEVAETVLEYPGVMLDKELERVHPAREDWVALSLAANKLGGQMGHVITIKNNHQVFEDIRAGRATWSDVADGYLSKAQIKHQKDLVAKLHAAFRARPAMPTGSEYDHPKVKHVIPDARFGHIWRTTMRTAVSAGNIIADWAGYPKDTPEGTPEERAPSGGSESTTIRAATAARLDALFSDPETAPYIDMFIDLLASAEEVIDSTEGRGLLLEYRQSLNSRHAKEPVDKPRAWLTRWLSRLVQREEPIPEPRDRLRGLMRHAVSARVQQLAQAGEVELPSSLESDFLGYIGVSEH
jgi:hypothetical protein